MLFKMVNKLCARIDKIDVAVEAPHFAAQLCKMRPTLKKELKADGVAADQLERTILTLSTAQMKIIKGIPALAGELAKILKAGSGEPAFRCIVAASLAYLVQPQDLLPDDLPGSYGFVDDALLLHEACVLSWEVAGDTARAEEKRKIFQFILMFVPDGSRDLFQNAIDGMAVTLNIMRSLDPNLAEMTTQMLIANPLQPITPQGASGAVARPSAWESQFAEYSRGGRPQYTWRDGSNMGVNFPGGGGVATDGRNIFVL